MILTIVVGVAAICVLVLVHELGHFIAAKATHCYVEEFGLGLPPRLWGKKWGETIYSINWIPFGGFNKLAGEVDPTVPRALAARSHGVRALVLSGGIICNLLLPFLLMIIAYMVPHDIVRQAVIIKEVSPYSPAEYAGIMAGDTILKVEGKEVNSIWDVSRYVQMKLATKMDITVRHADATEETVELVPRRRPPEGQGAVGIVWEKTEPVISTESLPFWRAIPKGFSSVWEALSIYKNGLIGMIIGTVPFTPSGVVGVIQVTGEVAHAGVSPLLELTAFISIGIGITQLIPFPALDGGRLLFIFIEWIRRGKRVPPRVEGVIHSAGFIILLALMVLVTYQDIVRWVTGGSLLGG